MAKETHPLLVLAKVILEPNFFKVHAVGAKEVVGSVVRGGVVVIASAFLGLAIESLAPATSGLVEALWGGIVAYYTLESVFTGAYAGGNLLGNFVSEK